MMIPCVYIFTRTHTCVFIERKRERRKERVKRLIYARVLIKSHSARVVFSKSERHK